MHISLEDQLYSDLFGHLELLLLTKYIQFILFLWASQSPPLLYYWVWCFLLHLYKAGNLYFLYCAGLKCKVSPHHASTPGDSSSHWPECRQPANVCVSAQNRLAGPCHSQAAQQNMVFQTQQFKTPQHSLGQSCLHLLRLNAWHMGDVRTWAVWADYLSTSRCPWATPTWHVAPYSRLFVLLTAAQMVKQSKTPAFSEIVTNSYSEFSKILVFQCRIVSLKRSWYIPWFRWDSSHQNNSRSTAPWHSIYNGRGIVLQ